MPGRPLHGNRRREEIDIFLHRVALVTLLLPTLALANGYNVPNVNPRDLARVDSARAAQDTAAAVYGNPAALAGIQGVNLSLGISLLDLRSDWHAPDGFTPLPLAASSPRSASLKFKPVPPPALFASYGGMLGDRGWGVGAGMNIPQGGNVYWPGDWAGRFRITTVDRKIYGFYGSAGIDVVKQVRIGGGVVYYYTTETLETGIDILDVTEAQARLEASGGAVAFDVSTVITPFDGVPLTLALDYKHQGVQKLTGKATFTDVPPGLATLLREQNVTHVLTIPNVLNIGAAWRVVPALNITAGFTFDRYKVYPEDLFAGETISLPVRREYGNGQTYRLGAEYTLFPELALRAGVQRDISGVQRDFYSPTLPDASSWAGAVGASWFFTPSLGIDAAFFYAHLDEISSTATRDAPPPAPLTPPPGPFPGRYDTQAFIYSAAFVYRVR